MAGGPGDQRTTAAAGMAELLPVPSFALKASARTITTAKADSYDARMSEPIEEREAWAAYETIPEVTTLVAGTANLISQCWFYPGVLMVEPGSGESVDLTLEEAATVKNGPVDYSFITEKFIADSYDVFDRYVDGAGSQAGLTRPMAECIDVVGACKIVGWKVDDDGEPLPLGATPAQVAGERWVAVAPGSAWQSRPATDIGPAQWSVRLSRTKATPIEAIVHKVWWPHPRYPDDSLGWVRSALDVCRDLRAFTLGQRSSARSGIPADLFMVPTEASPRKPEPAGVGPGNEGAIEAAQSAAEEWAADVEELIGEFILGVLEDYDAGNSAVPGVLAVESRFIEFFQKVSFSRQVDRGLGELVNQARSRLAASANCPAEMLDGLGGSTRWTGQSIADDEYRRYFRPKTMAIADGMTVALYWKDMVSRGYSMDDLRRVRTLVDPSSVVSKPDFSKLGVQLVDRFVIGPTGLRRGLHIPEAWAPTDEERKQMLEAKSAGKQQGASSGAGKGDQGAPTGAPNDPVPPQQVIQAYVVPEPPRQLAAAQPDLGLQLVAIEAEATARLEEACEAALDRAVEKAGAMLRNWARKQGGDLRALQAATPDNAQLVAMIGPKRAAELAADDSTPQINPDARAEEVFAAALVVLLAAFHRIAEGAFGAALALLGRELPQVEIDAAIGRAEDVLRQSMTMLADREVFGGPGPAGPDIGELSNLRIPGSVLRRVLAVAGGELGVGAGLEPDQNAVMGLVFGPLLSRVEPPSSGLRWVYGAAQRQRPYMPHQDLDGLTFSGATDDRLAGSPFGGSAFYHPGDHNGCQCRWARVFTTE